VPTREQRRSPIKSVALLFLIFSALLTLHFRLLKLPYFWDEAGYYVTAAHDLYLTGSLIPRTTISNAHPPLVMAYLALWWKIFGFAPYVTRVAMLFVSSWALLGLFRLARTVSNIQVAAASVICTALYPVFFAQSSLAHLDLAAAGFTFWGLKAYVEQRRFSTAAYFSFAVLTKETTILAPFALAGWEIVRIFWNRKSHTPPAKPTLSKPLLFALAFPILPLALWYGYHYLRTGFVFGNPEFLRYNVQATLHPLRIVLAMLIRLWQTFGYMNLLLLTVSGVIAMWLPPLQDQGKDRPRIALNVQFAFLFVVVAYVISMAVIGGAELARYMLPVVPLVILVFVSTLWRRVWMWHWVIALVMVGFVFGLFINPPYVFPPEDNLAYRDYIQLHQDAEHFLEARYPKANVLTAWPASDELTRPFLGYVSHPIRVVRIEDFRLEQVMSAADARPGYSVALVFSTKYDPPHPLIRSWPAWERIKARFFDSHQDVSPGVAAQVLGGKIVFSERRTGQWAAVIEMKQIMEAQAETNRASSGTNASLRSTIPADLVEDVEHHALPR
jgi:Dolichyl-phosphate-mannose-protein mannosyltransferase